MLMYNKMSLKDTNYGVKCNVTDISTRNHVAVSSCTCVCIRPTFINHAPHCLGWTKGCLEVESLSYKILEHSLYSV